jgi:hypothetical protein
MPTTSPRDPSPSVTGTMPWLLGLAIRLLAGALNMPEPLLHDTGIFVFTRVQLVESSLGKKLCPIRLWRQFRNWQRSTH